MMRQIFVALSVLALAGCQSKPLEQMSYSELAGLAAQIKQRCEDQGVHYPSREWDVCTRHETYREHSTRVANQARAARVQTALARGMQNMSGYYYRQSAITAANRPIQCTTVPAPAGQTSVRCY